MLIGPTGKCRKGQVDRRIWQPMLYTNAKRRCRSARNVPPDRLQVNGHAAAGTEGIEVPPNRWLVPATGMSQPVVTQNRNECPRLSSQDVVA